MSQENVRLVGLGYEAMNAAFAGADLDALVPEVYEPSIVLEMGTLEGTRRGHQAVKSFLEDQRAVIEDFHVDPEEFIDAGEQVIVTVRLSGRARHTGLPFKARYVHVVTLRNGKALHVRLYASKAQALEAVGLSE
jgi:ketosteroid isomerase-like protein